MDEGIVLFVEPVDSAVRPDPDITSRRNLQRDGRIGTEAAGILRIRQVMEDRLPLGPVEAV